MSDEKTVSHIFEETFGEVSNVNLHESDEIFERNLKMEKEKKMVEYETVFPTISSLEEKAEQQKKDSIKLLTSFEVDEKVKTLWKQIYCNAVDDRKIANAVFVDLYGIVIGEEDKFAVHGDKISKYLERMEKSNAQLIKLVEIISEFANILDEAKVPTGSDLFEYLEKEKNKKT